MGECFVEEFLRMGYNHKQILALFRNPHYLGMNLVLKNRGEEFVREQISEAFARWGRAVTWHEAGSSRREEAQTSFASAAPQEDQGLHASASTTDFDPTLTDPMGAAIPRLDL